MYYDINYVITIINNLKYYIYIYVLVNAKRIHINCKKNLTRLTFNCNK